MELWKKMWKKNTYSNQGARIMERIFATILWKKNILEKEKIEINLLLKEGPQIYGVSRYAKSFGVIKVQMLEDECDYIQIDINQDPR